MAKEMRNSKRWGKWTEEKVRELRDHYPTDTWDDLIKRFDMTKQSIISAACEFGVKRERTKYATFSKEEDELIVAYFDQGLTDEEISKLLPHRTANSINTRRSRIGATKPMLWSQEENDLLKELYNKMPALELTQYLPGRSRNAIVLHAEDIGLSWTGYRDYEYYTEEDYEFIRNNYSAMTDEEIAKILNRSKESIGVNRNKLGLHRGASIVPGESHYPSLNLFCRANLRDWKIASGEACNYKCVISGGRFDDIHHLVSFNTIVDDVVRQLPEIDFTKDINDMTLDEKKLIVETLKKEHSKHPLGVCLRHDIHVQFHTEYGSGCNTVEQFLDFAERFYPDVQLNIA